MRLPQKRLNLFSCFLLAEIGIRGEFIGTIWIYWNLLHRLGWNIWIYRKKFRSQTSDNMDRWKAEQGRGREKRKIRRKKSRRERVRRKKMQMREKLGKSRNTVFFQWFGAQEGRKVGSLKRRVPDERWKIARRCGAKHISKSKCTKHTILGPCRKSARRCGAKHISKSTC